MYVSILIKDFKIGVWNDYLLNGIFGYFIVEWFGIYLMDNV